jgi:hypothetical protein
MAIKQGDSVTNSKCSDWGTGVVLSIGSSSAEVRFPTVGAKRLLVDVLVRSLERATIVDKKGRKADPQYQAKLRELVDAFSTADNREEIPNIEAMIYEAFLVSGVGKGAIKRQLTQWMRANLHGREKKGFADAKALYEFLFPESPRDKKAS